MLRPPQGEELNLKDHLANSGMQICTAPPRMTAPICCPQAAPHLLAVMALAFRRYLIALTVC